MYQGQHGLRIIIISESRGDPAFTLHALIDFGAQHYLTEPRVVRLLDDAAAQVLLHDLTTGWLGPARATEEPHAG
jgi:hypothetical protein